MSPLEAPNPRTPATRHGAMDSGTPALRPAGPRSIATAVLVILAGVSAALHVAKLFPALPALRDALGISLVEAGFLLSAVQLAGMTLGLAIGLLADGVGLKRCMLAGLLLLAGASGLGGWATAPAALLALRAVEGAGFLLVVTPAPALIRMGMPARHLGVILGIWSSYIPFATGLVLLVGPLLIGLAGWQVLWWALSGLSLVMALLVWRYVPADGGGTPRTRTGTAWAQRLRQTLSARGPWLVALCFGAYSGQWVAVIGFLPSIYLQAGFSGAATAWLTALAAAVNILGNVASGWLLGRRVAPQVLLYTGFCVMALGAFMAFSGWITLIGAGFSPIIRYGGVLLFSMVGGIIPGTLFAMAVRLAPGHDTVSTTVGWMQQWSACGQFAGPPVVAWVAGATGGWGWTWTVTGGCAVAGVLLAWQLGREAGGEVGGGVGGPERPAGHADLA